MAENEVVADSTAEKEEKTIAEADSSVTAALCNQEAVEKLSEGLVALYQPHVLRIKRQLLELTKKQEHLVKQLEGENCEFQSLVNANDLQDMMSAVKGCLNKLNSIKKDMSNIHDRTTRLKKRALRLQQAKQREALERTSEREERLLQEQRLIADPAWASGAAGTAADSTTSVPSASPLVSPSEVAEEDVQLEEGPSSPTQLP